jgi:hypothetical protein
MADICGGKVIMNCWICDTLKTSFFEFPTVYLVYSNNVHYLRMRAMSKLSTQDYRHDILSGNVADYIAEGVY